MIYLPELNGREFYRRGYAHVKRKRRAKLRKSRPD